MTDDLRTLEAMQRAAFDAAFPGLPPGLSPEEARRRINAALAAVLPAHRRQVLAEAADACAAFAHATQGLGLGEFNGLSNLAPRLIRALAADARTASTPARIDGAGRTGAGAGERVDDAQDDSGGRDG